MFKFPQRHNKEKKLFIALLLVIGLFSWLIPEQASAARKTSANRECAICHIMWLEDFKRQDVSPLVPYDPLPTVNTGKQDVVSTEQMCFSCHDGFVLDSRSLWKKNHYNHPVGVIPSDKVTIPTDEGKTIFPMNNDGKLYCGSCHTAHSQDWNEKNTTLFMRTNNDDSSMCTACHAGRLTGPEKGNHPVNKKLEKIPPSLLKAGSQFSNRDEIICQSCHLVHGAEDKRILARANQNSDLCASCHEDKARVRNTKHDMTIVAPDSKNVRAQKVTESGPCSACHIPHDSKGPRLWAQADSFDKDAASAFCLNCHQKKGLGNKKTIGKNSHPTNVLVSKVGIVAKKDSWISRVKNKAAPKKIIPLPLFDESGKRVSEGGNISCLSCHDPHQWSSDHAQETEGDVRKLEGDGTNSFLRIANDETSALCLNCHRSQAPVAFSKHNLDISAPKESNKDGKRASESGTCSACHLPHNGSGKTMWARKVANNAAGVMSKCIDCHEAGKVAGKKTTGEYSHPLQVNLDNTGGKTDLPLYLKNGERNDKKGLIDCATCHDPHQWDPSNATAVSGKKANKDGDASNSFLRMKASEGAELCANCHIKQKNIIATDHDLTVTANKALNIKQQSVVQSGACGQCHSVHNAELPQRLWAQPLGRGKHEAEKLCTGCHSPGGIARAKVPFLLEHPPRTLSSGEGRLRADDKLKVMPPLFSADGQSAKAGLISCLTCHDPHQWDADKIEKGAGENLEGDVSNSFLRHSSTEYFICSDCHGEESIFRYKYFHMTKSRPDKDLDDY